MDGRSDKVILVGVPHWCEYSSNYVAFNWWSCRLIFGIVCS